MGLLKRHRKPVRIVECIPDDVWNVLGIYEQEILFLVEDRLVGRFDNDELRIRLDAKATINKYRGTVLPVRR